MRVYGASVIKGMLYTLKTFFETYIEDFKRLGGKDSEYKEHGLRSFEEGVVTVQYPETPMPIGSTFERFRVLPMLIYDQLPAGETSPAPAETRAAKEYADKNIRCTACGICAKVCPPQCIWIVQESDEKGKPITVPKDFWIDMSVCMNCGMCSEFCPFDAIKMDHQFALNTTEQRRENYLYDMERLLVPAEYYAELHPKANAEEEAVRKADAEAKAAKEAAKKEAAAKKAAEAASAPAAPADAAAPAAPAADA
ncbi:MAG: 4Fe-4S binding protein, partial [Candidatus Sericytochromatia bacterium]